MLRGIVVPGFFDQSSSSDPQWSELAQAAARISIRSVFDDHSVLQGVYGQMAAAGVAILGYVDTSQGSRAQDAVTAAVDAWFTQFPNVVGIFFDQGPPLNANDPETQEPAATVSYYSAIYQHVKGQQPSSRTIGAPLVMLNCGGLRDANFARQCLDIAVWEQDDATYVKDSWWQAATGGGGEWWTSAATTLGKTVAHVVQSVSAGDKAAMQAAVSLANARGADEVYVYDGTSAAYKSLPSFWSAEVDAVAGIAGSGGGTNGGSGIARPQAAAPEWQVIGAADAAAALARDVQQPNPVDATQYIWGRAREASVTLDLPALTPAAFPANCTAWYYANTGADTQLVAEVVVAGSPAAEATIAPGSGFAWQSIAFTVPDARGAGEVALRFTTAFGPDSNVRAAYVEYAGQSSQPGNVIVVGPNLKVRPSDHPTGSGSVSLIGACNEVLSFQIVVPAGASPLTGLTASVPGPLSGPAPIDAASVRLYREAYYVVQNGQQTGPDSAGPGPWPDPLIPAVDSFYEQARNAFPVDVPAGENRVIWVDILVPEGAPAGDYTGSIHVSTGAWSTDVPVQIHVIPFVMPSTATLRSSFSVNSEQVGTILTGGGCWSSGPTMEGCWEANELFLACGLDHRTTLSNAWLQDPDQNAQAFATHLRPYLDGSGGRTALAKAQMTTLEYDPAHLAGWRGAVEPLGTGAEPFIYLRTQCDEIYAQNSSGCGRWTSVCWPAISGVLQSWTGARIVMTIDAQTSGSCGMASAINGAGGHIVITPVIDHMEGKASEGDPYPGNQRSAYDTILADRNELWLYCSCDSWGCGQAIYSGWASYAIDAAGSQNRAMSWLCFLYGATGELYYQAVQSLANAWADGGQYVNLGNGDGTLVYAGLAGQATGDGEAPLGGTNPIPIESIRLKLIRAGRQDYEYLNYLAAHGQAAQASSIATGLFPNAYSTIRTDDQVEGARRQLVQAVEQLIAAQRPSAVLVRGRDYEIYATVRGGSDRVVVLDENGGLSAAAPQAVPVRLPAADAHDGDGDGDDDLRRAAQVFMKAMAHVPVTAGTSSTDIAEAAPDTAAAPPDGDRPRGDGHGAS